MRPMTGTLTAEAALAFCHLSARAPSFPRSRYGSKPRAPPMAERLGHGRSGSRTISMARARWGRRRMKPRSSSAVISRWMPDFDLRSRASFISSKEGEHARLLQPLMDEHQELFLLRCQHLVPLAHAGRTLPLYKS